MAITAASLSAKAKNGWAWRLGKEGATFAEFEPKLVIELERQGGIYNFERLEHDMPRRGKVNAIQLKLKDASDEQIAAALTALGVTL